MDKAKKLVQDKQQKELEECTFAPQLIAKQKAIPRPQYYKGTSIPIEEQKIPAPILSMANKVRAGKYKDNLGDSPAKGKSPKQPKKQKDEQPTSKGANTKSLE